MHAWHGTDQTIIDNAMHAWHGTDQIVIDNAIDEWHGRLRTCMRAKGGHLKQLLWQYSATWQETFQFLSNVTRFLDCFWKLSQIQTSNFHNVVQQHTEDIVEVLRLLFEIYLSFQQ